MAHFARLDQDNTVIQVVVIGNDVPTSNGPLGENHMHIDGETYCQNLFKGGTWKQCSYNANFRGVYPGVGYTYDPVADKFKEPQPHKGWVFNDNLNKWEPPVPMPDGVNEDPPVNYVWSDKTEAWIDAKLK